MKCKNWSKSVW